MGASSLLDIVGSFIFAGFLLLMGLNLNASANEVRAVYSGNYNLQANLTTVVELIEGDFRKIGYCRTWQKTADPSKSLRIADSSRIRFLCDYDNNGSLDSVTYWLGPPSELASTPNPNDCYLYRQINSATPTKMNFGLTQFSFTYRDAEDSTLAFPISNPRLAYYLTLTLSVSSPAPYEQNMRGQYLDDPSKYQVIWKQMRLITKNLKNR
jgi:type II secretory pathway component PulJ